MSEPSALDAASWYSAWRRVAGRVDAACAALAPDLRRPALALGEGVIRAALRDCPQSLARWILEEARLTIPRRNLEYVARDQRPTAAEFARGLHGSLVAAVPAIGPRYAQALAALGQVGAWATWDEVVER